MENSISDQIWFIRMPRHVLRTLQLPSHIPNHDEYDLPQSHHRTSRHSLHG